MSVEALLSYKPNDEELERNSRICQKNKEVAEKRKEEAKKKRSERRKSRRQVEENPEDPEAHADPVVPEIHEDVAGDYVEDLIDDLVQNDPGVEDLFGGLDVFNLEDEEMAIPRSRRKRKPRPAPKLRDQYFD